MNQKAEKPTLSGQRLKTRKRDEKEKYDPSTFRDAIIQGLNEAGTDLEQVSKFLDVSATKLNLRRYSDVLLDILFAGGQLAPGGSLVEDSDPDKVIRTNACVFSCDETVESLRSFYEVLYKLIRRYKYLERAFEDELSKILLFLKGFTEEERRKLAIITGIIMANGLASAKVLNPIFEEHLVKEGLSLEFATLMFKTWLAEKDVNSLYGYLKKSQLEGRLLELFPLNKRNQENFAAYFREQGLGPIADVQRVTQTSEVKKELQKQLSDMVHEDAPVKEVIAFVKENMIKNNLQAHDLVIIAWNTIMAAVEWNKKDELVAEQAMKHLRTYTPLLAELTTSTKSEINLMLKVQEYCYENQSFMKVFQKIIVLFYKNDVLSEDAILKWYKQSHSSKGKRVFLEQMKNFVEWLENAEEESEDEEEDDDNQAAQK
ncbi:eIF5-mimic protein 2-like isoform X2 [Liolophura sinensis]